MSVDAESGLLLTAAMQPIRPTSIVLDGERVAVTAVADLDLPVIDVLVGRHPRQLLAVWDADGDGSVVLHSVRTGRILIR